MTTVHDLFTTLLDPLNRFRPTTAPLQYPTDFSPSTLKDIPLASHVGECSRLAITEAARLLAVLDSHPDVRNRVLGAVVAHIGILYYG